MNCGGPCAGRRHPASTTCRHLKVKTEGGFAEVGFTIRPLRQPEGLRGTLLVVFEEPPPAKEAKSRRRKSPAASPEIAALAEELQFVKADLQAAIEELQATNEELQSANEEMQSTNEELQSTNEELDTSREEIQSVNEELLTVNAELQTKMENLYRAESDMKNLLDSTRVAMIFLDRSLRLQRFTPTAVQLVKLIPTDVGRSLGDLVLNLDYDQLLADAREVLDTLKPREREVRGRGAPDRGQTWFLVQIIPPSHRGARHRWGGDHRHRHHPVKADGGTGSGQCRQGPGGAAVRRGYCGYGAGAAPGVGREPQGGLRQPFVL